MKEKTKLKIIQILCIISILTTVFSIQRTYAKYFEKIDTIYATNIKKWVINVNEKNIHNEETLTNVMTPVFFHNEHMNNNDTLVPGRIGCFDFVIDYTNVDVEFDFSFNIEQTNTTKLTDFEVYAYKILDLDFEITPTTTIDDIGEITTLSKINGKYQLSEITQTIDPTTAEEKQKRIIVIFRWNDTEENLMDNEADTKFKETEINYKVGITFTQKV